MPSSLNLYCASHEELHQVDVESAERIIYFLAAAAGELDGHPVPDPDILMCPLQVLTRAESGVGLGAYVAEPVASRRALDPASCPTCRGTGDNPSPFRLVGDGDVVQDDDCPDCRGTGNAQAAGADSVDLDAPYDVTVAAAGLEDGANQALLVAVLVAQGGSVDLTLDQLDPDAMGGPDGTLHAVGLVPLDEHTVRLSVVLQPSDQQG